MRVVVVSIFVISSLGLVACGDDTSDPCKDVVCGRGECVVESGEATCECEAGYRPDDTQAGLICVDVAVCEADSCSGHGTCAPSGADLVCTCETGYVGATCDTCDTGFVAVGDSCVTPGVAQCGDAASFDWRDAVMYFALVDRFFDSDGESMPVDGVTGMTEGGSSGQYEGGDLAGVTAKMGYLADLGVTALWISAPFENRNTRGRGINDPRWYSGYHGYWPSPANIDYSDPDNPEPEPRVEDRIGTMSDLEALIASAKSAQSADGHGIKVLLDYVMKHVDDESPLYLENPDWFTKDEDGNIPLCQPNNWWNHPYWGTRCAFTPYLPAFDFWQEAPRRWSVNDALWWAKRLGIDGYRLDAIKHVPFEWLTELRARIEDEIGAPSGDRFYLVGETFDYDNRELLKSFVDPDTMLDGQFDFPFKKRLCEAVFRKTGTGGLTPFATWMDGNDGFYDVEGAAKRSIMTTWIGNHDVPRAIHFASGQITDCGRGSDNSNSWTNTFLQPTEAEPYELLGLAFAVMMTNPGVPLIYYGDEIGLAGGGDPNNRRLMPWDDSTLNEHQLALRTKVRALARARASEKALSRGKRTTVSSTADTWVYKMGGCGEVAPDVVVAINRGAAATSINLPDPGYVDVLSGATVAGGALSLGPRDVRILRVAR